MEHVRLNVMESQFNFIIIGLNVMAYVITKSQSNFVIIGLNAIEYVFEYN